MKNRIALTGLVAFASLIVFFAGSAQAQVRTAGRVVEVLDGRTITVAAPTGNVKVELQFIEVPEPEQQLSSVVRSHLEKLLLNKTVEVTINGLWPGKTRAQVFVDGIDVSCQMLRDGAAWHMPREESGQDTDAFAAYAEYERIARSEKRGVWAVAGLQPAWLFRAQKIALVREKEEATVRPVRTETARPKASRPKGQWSDKNPAIGDVGALTHGYNSAKKVGYVSTTLLGITELEKAVTNDFKTAMDFTYWYKEGGRAGRTGTFVVTIVSDSPTVRFLKNNDLVVLSGERKVVIGKAVRTSSMEGDRHYEKLTYEVERSSIETLVHGTVVLKVGDYLIHPTSFGYSILHNMLQVSSPRQVAKNEKPAKGK
jgi:endonuclease YncB( thermonuclease family)